MNELDIAKLRIHLREKLTQHRCMSGEEITLLCLIERYDEVTKFISEIGFLGGDRKKPIMGCSRNMAVKNIYRDAVRARAILRKHGLLQDNLP